MRTVCGRGARFASVALALASCQFAKPADVPSDAPVDAPTDAPIDARPDVVTGTVSTGYRTAAGVTERFTDLSTTTIEALIPDATEPTGAP